MPRSGALLALAISLAACHGAPPAPTLTAETSVLRAGERAWYRFSRTTVERCDVNDDGSIATKEVGQVDAARGRPVVAAFDPRGGYGAVAYEHGVACLSFVDGRIRWADAPWSVTPRDLCVSGEKIAVVAGNSFGLFTLPELERVRADASSDASLADLSRWLALAKLAQLWYVVPLEGHEFAALGHTPLSTFGEPRTELLKLDLGGVARDAITQRGEIGQMSILGDCAYDGEGIVVAGILEEARQTPGRGPELLHSLRVVRVAPATFAQQVLVHAELDDKRRTVVQLAVERDLVAVVFDDGGVRAWRTGEKGRARELYADRFGPGTSVACLSRTSLVVCLPDGSTRVSPPLGE
jgi:hypothetical protein